ncbi:MAG: endopeptidase La [Andreesenia angusta]|nr:endopeptidase La [Andreesenia angusta]
MLRMPMIPLRGISILPNSVQHFDIGRSKSIEALNAAMEDDSMIFLTAQKNLEIEDPKEGDYYDIGVICKIKQVLKLPGDAMRLLVSGVSRGRIDSIDFEEPYIQVYVEDLSRHEKVINYNISESDLETEAMKRVLMEAFEELVTIGGKISPESISSLEQIDDVNKFTDVVASYLPINIKEKQKILETLDIKTRLEELRLLVEKEIQIMKIEEKINRRVKKQINKTQKDYYLREQMRAIQKELGDGEVEETEEMRKYMKKAESLDLDEEVATKVKEEIQRLGKVGSTSAEAGVIRNYLDCILDLPWNKETEDRIDIKMARDILDEDHYGLKDVKERILEYLAIRKLSDNPKAPILCLVGPPGVGKTSIAKSVSRSVERKFIRMSLGGVRDEAEIRGHRRTYIGAIPGRIISSIRKVGTKNPVFLLDEIDKLSGDFRGDPASALLEVLDPEQNSTFTDHYLELPFDLSKVMFITTANTLNTIPGPLLDRMEVIRISGYTRDEKFNIAKKYLLPKQLKEHGLSEEKMTISDNALYEIIDSYTREAGVRNLEREIANLCRKVGKDIVEGISKKARITNNNIVKYLGNKKFRIELIAEQSQIGLVRGLAWTSVGGETLSIEVNIMPGNGKVQLTGKLGDVMKESAMTGISYIRSRMKVLNIDLKFFKEHDIHIHVPEGATPKDGPSAGIAMATAVISAIIGEKIDNKLAMTGEVTLRGTVLPVGGIKEKVLAAHRAGIDRVILPIDNKRDIDEVPNKVKKDIEFTFVKNMDEVIKKVFGKELDDININKGFETVSDVKENNYENK